MKTFDYVRADDAKTALRLYQDRQDGARYLGGGTNLVDLMREDVESAGRLVDVSRLDATITLGETMRIGAATKNTALASHPVVRDRFPVLSEAILMGASGQIRNMASVAGNVLQRTRCSYFYDGASHCNKRAPGTGCDAIAGFHRMHAILGASSACIATHPSDMCVALAALDAVVHVEGKSPIDFVGLHRLPGDAPARDTILEPGDLITAIELRPLSIYRRSMYRKVRDRASYAFALVSVAAALEVENGKVKDVRLALGGVAHKPWRARIAEDALLGQPANEATFRAAAEAELAPAVGLAQNAFKIELVKRVITSVLMELSQ